MVLVDLNPSQTLGLDLDRHIALDAGAGTGKTTVMATRYVHHLLTKDQRATRLLPPGREDILRSVFLHRLKLYPSQKEFERACEAYLLSGGGDIKNTRENAASLKRERVELARICRQSEMNCLERAIEKLTSKAVLAQNREDDAMFSVFA